MDKRTFIKSIALGTVGAMTAGLTSQIRGARTARKWNGEFVLPELAYSYDALEPYIDARTMELHHSKHHASYTSKFNTAVKEAGLTGKTANEILSEVSKYNQAIRNNGGGYHNHKLFWQMLAPASGQQPSPDLTSGLTKAFGSVDAFKEEFNNAAKTVFGSGWAWLIADGDQLKITSTSNQDSPIMDIAKEKGFPLLCIDVWEHAYYLKYQNKRADYVDAYWNVVNWEFVSKRFEQYMSANHQV